MILNRRVWCVAAALDDDQAHVGARRLVQFDGDARALAGDDLRGHQRVLAFERRGPLRELFDVGVRGADVEPVGACCRDREATGHRQPAVRSPGLRRRRSANWSRPLPRPMLPGGSGAWPWCRRRPADRAPSLGAAEVAPSAITAATRRRAPRRAPASPPQGRTATSTSVKPPRTARPDQSPATAIETAAISTVVAAATTASTAAGGGRNRSGSSPGSGLAVGDPPVRGRHPRRHRR